MTSAHAVPQKRETPRTGDAVAGPELTISVSKLSRLEREGKMPQQVDELPSTDKIILAGAMRDLALAARSGAGTYLTNSQCTALAELVNAKVIESGNGMAVLYEIAEVNPTLSTPAARRREAERMDIPVCQWCLYPRDGGYDHSNCGPGAQVSR